MTYRRRGIRRFFSVFLNLIFLGGFSTLLYLLSLNYFSINEKFEVLIGFGLSAFIGILLFFLPFFKKSRIAPGFDFFAFLFLLIPAAYLVLFPQFFNFQYGITYFLPQLSELKYFFNIVFGYALAYTFFEHTTSEYQKTARHIRLERRMARKEKRAKRQQQRELKREKRRINADIKAA